MHVSLKPCHHFRILLKEYDRYKLVIFHFAVVKFEIFYIIYKYGLLQVKKAQEEVC
jgi:hypothetical protein